MLELSSPLAIIVVGGNVSQGGRGNLSAPSRAVLSPCLLDPLPAPPLPSQWPGGHIVPPGAPLRGSPAPWPLWGEDSALGHPDLEPRNQAAALVPSHSLSHLCFVRRGLKLGGWDPPVQTVPSPSPAPSMVALGSVSAPTSCWLAAPHAFLLFFSCDKGLGCCI